MIELAEGNFFYKELNKNCLKVTLITCIFLINLILFLYVHIYIITVHYKSTTSVSRKSGVTLTINKGADDNEAQPQGV